VYLKRLELFGFKTFAERVSLDFAPGITAVVGPNGSGKSNLSEAILWVFGEQSLKALRSSRSQDIIFAGSKDKKALGLAEVSLTLDNSSGKLGLDFSEVTVTRRVYRSGEGEYLLNRVPCRMRDIHDLFLDTGIGRQAYSIIGQSQIDAILSVRPEDRRELVEEVAGVGKYRQRKKEAQRKLDATRANLLRVNDIAGELENQLEPLARQSEAARDYAQISRELSALRLSLLVADHDAFTASLQRAKEREAELEEAIEQTRTCDAQQAAEEVTLRAQLAGIEEKLDELRALSGRLTQEVDRQEGQEALAQEKIHASVRQRQQIEADCRHFRETIELTRSQAAEAEKLRQEIEAKEADAQVALRDKETALGTTDSEAVREEQAIVAARREHLDLLGKIAERKNVHTQGASLLRAAQARLARLAEEAATAQGELDGLTGAENERNIELEQLLTKLPVLHAQLDEFATQRQQADAKLNQCLTNEQQLTKECMQVRSRLEALEALAAAHEGLSPAAKSLLEQGFDLVSDLARAPQDYAVAIEVALGAWLEGLVCADQATALQGRELLRSKGGQAAFLTLDSFTNNAPALPVGLEQDPGFAGQACALIDCADVHRALFNTLLGHTVVVNDLDTALRLRARLAEGWQIVTTEGETVTALGLVLGKERGSEGPLARRAEIASLREKLAGLEAKLAYAQEELNAARQALSTVVESIATTRKELDQTDAARGRLEEALKLLKNQISRASQRLDAIETEQAELEREAEESQREQAILEEEIAGIEGQGQQTATRLTEAEAALSAVRERRQAAAHEISQMRVALAALAGERKTQEARITSLAESEKSLGQQIVAREESLQQLETEKANLEASLEGLGKKLEEMRAAATRAKADLEQTADARQQILETIAQQLEAQKANREQRETHQGSLHRLQLRITQLDGELAFLGRNLEEDHRISLEKARELAQPLDNRKDAQERLSTLQSQVDALGTVNLGAMEEYQRVKERIDFLSTQRQDLERAREDLERVIAEIDATAREKFLETFELVKKEFTNLFVRLFGGGETELSLVGEAEILDAGIEVEVTVPGKKRQNLLLLSGGERALTAMALVFALMRVKPTPFVVMDEIDAPLDDSNVGRFSDLLRDFAREAQFICITHNKSTMEAADTIYGVTMQKAGVSSLISMKLSELPAG
jgi:chromosome segregation protein